MTIVLRYLAVTALAFLAATTPSASLANANPVDAAAQATEPAEPLAVVENFLLARNIGDYSGAASWCATPMELQDEDSWYVDPAATSDWLRQLMEGYLIDTFNQPRANGNVVTWSERLTKRGPVLDPAEIPARMTVEVHAVVEDGKITYLSGAYPPIPLHLQVHATTQIASVEPSGGKVLIPPAALFVVWALGLGVLVLLAYLLSGLVRLAARRSCMHDAHHSGRLNGSV
jgi:hypothetical protein